MIGRKGFANADLEFCLRHHPRYLEMEGELAGMKARMKRHKQEMGTLHQEINRLKSELAECKAAHQ